MPRPPHYFKRWRVECTVCTFDALSHWVRWVSPAGRPWRLHPTQCRWIPEGQTWRLREPMPHFQSAFAARAAILDAPKPPEA